MRYSSKITGYCLGAVFSFGVTKPAFSATVRFLATESRLKEISRETHLIKVVLDQPLTQGVWIPIKLTGTATSQDYTLGNNQNVFIDRGKTEANISIQMRDDRLFEGEESLSISLAPDKTLTLGEPKQHQITIEDNEGPPPLLTIVTQDIVIDEKNMDLELEFRLSRASTESVQFQIRESGSATRSDYNLQSTSIRFNPGQTRATARISIRDDKDIEGEENVNLTLNQLQNSAPGEKTQIKITIKASDQPKEDTQWKERCRDDRAGSMSYSYCVTTTMGSTSKDVLFFFHGAFGSKNDWTKGAELPQDLTRQLRLHWKKTGFQAPAVVAISLGFQWMLNLNGNSAANFDMMADFIIPKIERQEFGGPPLGRRLLWGVSMGGFNAGQLLFRRPEMWDKAVLVAPLMIACNPYQSEGMIYACLATDPHQMNGYLAYQAHAMVKEWFPNSFDWREANLINLGLKNIGPNSPPLLLTSGNIDEFGFHTMNKELALRGIQQGAPIEWQPTQGVHGYFDPIVAAEFLQRE